MILVNVCISDSCFQCNAALNINQTFLSQMYVHLDTKYCYLNTSVFFSAFTVYIITNDVNSQKKIYTILFNTRAVATLLFFVVIGVITNVKL